MEHKVTLEDHISTGQNLVTDAGTVGLINYDRMILNPNKDVVTKIINRIQINDGNCPCQAVEDGKDTRCPCSDFLDHRKCHCSLFVSAK